MAGDRDRMAGDRDRMADLEDGELESDHESDMRDAAAERVQVKRTACSFCSTRSCCVHIDWFTVCWYICANQWRNVICSGLNIRFERPQMYCYNRQCNETKHCYAVRWTCLGQLQLVMFSPSPYSSFAHMSRLKHSYFNNLLDCYEFFLCCLIQGWKWFWAGVIKDR